MLDRIQYSGLEDDILNLMENAVESGEIATEAAKQAKISEANAKDSENKAKVSEVNSKKSENAALRSELNAKTSEINAKASEISAKDSADKSQEIYEAFAKGAVYRGVWNPQELPSYPPHYDVNSYWDVTLNIGTVSFELMGITWFAGDRLIYSVPNAQYFHIGHVSGVSSVNGDTGNVVVTPQSIKALPLTGGTLTGPVTINAPDGGLTVRGSNNVSTIYGNKSDNTNSWRLGKFTANSDDIGLFSSVYTNGLTLKRDGIYAYVNNAYVKLYYPGNDPTVDVIGALPLHGKADDSAKLNGFIQSKDVVADTLVQRSSDGSIQVKGIESTYDDQASISGSIAFRNNNTTDRTLRFCNNKPNIRTYLEVSSIAENDAKYYSVTNKPSIGDITGSIDFGRL